MSSPSGSTAAAHTAAAWCSTACWNSRPGTTLFATATSLPPGSPGTSHHCAAVPVTRRAWNVQPHTDPGAPPKCSSNSTPVNCIPQSSVIGVRSSVGFDAVAQGEAGAGVDGVGVVEDVAELVDGGGVPWRGERV